MKHLYFLLFLCISLFSCDKDPECYECHSRIMPRFYFCGFTPEEMQHIIELRKGCPAHDTMTCVGIPRDQVKE